MTLLYKKSKVKEIGPKDFQSNSLREILVPKKTPSVVNYYAHWCPHCNNPETVAFWEALGEKLPKHAGIHVFAFNCDLNNEHRDVAENVGVHGFPTFRFYDKNGKSFEYNGSREIRPFLEFLKSHMH